MTRETFSYVGQSIENFVMRGVLNFIGKSDPRYIFFCLFGNASIILYWYPVVLICCLIFVASAHSYLHHEVLDFILVTMSTQLRSGPCPGPKDVHPFIDAAMSQVILGWYISSALWVLDRWNFRCKLIVLALLYRMVILWHLSYADYCWILLIDRTCLLAVIIPSILTETNLEFCKEWAPQLVCSIFSSGKCNFIAYCTFDETQGS